MATLSELFDASEARHIHWNGYELARDLVVKVGKGDEVHIRFLRSCDVPVQGIGITGKSCQLEISGTRSAHIGLWRDTAPAEVILRVATARSGATITFFNQWRDEKHGTTMYHVNNAAMQIEQESPNVFLVRCSDGWGPVDLSDLEFRIALNAKPST